LEKYSSFLRREANPIWERILVHPFLTEMAKGTLPLNKFQYYLKQDHSYLFDYSRFLGLAASRCETLEQVFFFSEILSSEFHFEIEMQRTLANKVGLNPMELAATKMAPTTKAYTSFLLKVAATEGIGEIVAAMSPCPLTYAEIGETMILKDAEKVPAYACWLASYRSKEALEVCIGIRQMIDSLGASATISQRQRMLQNFLDASRYEYLFWDMAYNMEQWPI
jgi:thiaminase/transcriptional activator TenA